MQSLKSQLEKQKKKGQQLKEENSSLKQRAGAAEARAKQAEQANYQDAKARTAIAVKAEEEHQNTLRALQESYEMELEEAYTIADAETAKWIAAEEARLKSEADAQKKLDAERKQSAKKLRLSLDKLEK